MSWWSVHEFVAGLLNIVGTYPTVGTPEWCELPADDLRKIAAIFDAAQHWALRIETSQHAQIAAAEDVADAADWSAIGTDIYRREAFYEARPWLRRAAS